MSVILTGLLGVLLVWFACAFLVKRALWRRSRRLGKVKLGFYPSSGSLGNALHVLQTIAEPQVRYAVSEILKEEAEDDTDAGPDDPTRHLLRQAERIRRGERVDRLTALLSRASSRESAGG